MYVGTAQMTEEDIVREVPDGVARLGVITSEPVEKVVIEEPWQVREVEEFETIRVMWMKKE